MRQAADGVREKRLNERRACPATGKGEKHDALEEGDRAHHDQDGRVRRRQRQRVDHGLEPRGEYLSARVRE